jgi:hypothetical protein
MLRKSLIIFVYVLSPLVVTVSSFPFILLSIEGEDAQQESSGQGLSKPLSKCTAGARGYGAIRGV